MRFAHLTDPFAAVDTSSIEPYPHQIDAVYNRLLPQRPVRFVLADDPGAGKTIMSGLLIRELMLRGDVDPVSHRGAGQLGRTVARRVVPTSSA